MTAVQKHLGILLVLLSGAVAQTSGGSVTVQSVTTARDGDDLRVDITLSAPVKATAETAVHPDRILLDLPGTTSSDNTKNTPVNANGVRRVRTGQHSTSPLVTRVVLDLDRARAYTLKTEGNHIIVTVGAAENARRDSSHGAPVAAASGNVLGNLLRRRDRPTPLPEENSTSAPPPIPPTTATGPAFEPPSESSSAATLPPERPAAPVPQSQPVPLSPVNSAGQASFEENQIATVNKPVSSPASTSPAVPSASAPSTAPPPTRESSTVAPGAAAATQPASKRDEATMAATAPTSSPASPETAVIARSDDPSLRTVFKVKYVAEGRCLPRGWTRPRSCRGYEA